MRGLIETAALWLTLLTTNGSSPAPAVSVLGTTPGADLLAAPAVSEHAAAEVPAPAAPRPVAPALQRAINRNVGFGLLHLPKDFEPDRCDLLIHFHGADSTVQPQFDAALPTTALLVVNAGMQSGPYEARFSDAAALDRTIAGTQKALDDVLGERKCPIGRVALSAWSAGFGAVLRILAHQRNVQRVDAVLLADGMHAGYRDKRTHEVEPVGMKPFVRFAQAASDGEKLMSVTHSSVTTYGYASTTEAASFLMQSMDLTKQEQKTDGPGSMVMRYRTDRRGMHVKGYEGEDAAAHCDHLFHVGETLFADLRDRWSSP